MNKPTYKVLVDPEFALELRDVLDFLNEFGPFNGQYLPRYPANWVTIFVKHIEELCPKTTTPVMRQQILERVRRKLPACLVPVDWKYSDDMSWGDNVKKALQNQRNPVLVGNALDPHPFSGWFDALEKIRRFRRRSWSFQGTLAEYRDTCLPLLVNSPACYLVDRFLDPLSEDTEFLLRALFKAASGSRCYSIEIITRREICGQKTNNPPSFLMTDSEIEEKFRRIYADVLPKDRVLKLHLVNDGTRGGATLRLHDRFFITMNGSINFGEGYLVSDQKFPQQNAYLNDEDHHLYLYQTYVNGVARHIEKLPRVPSVAYPKSVSTIIVESA